MAMLISRATGNFTAAATWGVADAATNSQLTNPSASTNTTTSYVYSSTFTGTNTRVADGIVLFLKRLNTTGTVTVALSDDNGVTATRSVTVNASDLPADESWVFFKFGTTLTLDGGTDYRVGVVASDANNALIYRNATAGNWARMVSTTTTGAPAATDTMLIVGEWTGAGSSSSYTVTMDNTTTTDFGIGTTSGLPSQTNAQTYSGIQIGQNGTLTWGTSAATNYYLKLSGNLIVWSGGTYNMGTAGTPCPRDSTMTLLFDSTGNTTTSSFVIGVFNGSTTSAWGQSRTSGKNTVSCKLSADAAANATSLTVDTDTGWLDNDEIVVATTTQTNTQTEAGTLNGAAGASTLTVDGFAGTAGGLAFAHSGTYPTQAEIINLSRNVIITGNSTSQGFSFIGTSVSSFNLQWVRLVFFGSFTGQFTSATSSATVEYCAFSNIIGLFSTGLLISFNNNVSWGPSNIANNTFLFGAFASTITNNIVMRGTGGFQAACVANVTFSNNTAVGMQTGFSITATTTGSSSAAFSNLVAHGCSTSGVAITASTGLPQNLTATINGVMSWRNASNFSTSSTMTTVINNAVSFGSSGSSINASTVGALLVTFNSSIFAGDTSFASPSGLNFTNSGAIGSQFTFNNCQFSPTSGIYVPFTTADINLASASVRPMITMTNTLLGAATEVNNPQNLTISGFIKSSKHDQTEGAFKSWFQSGIIERDTTIYNTASPSERLTPSSASIKLQSGPRLVAVDDLGTVTINVYVRKSVAGDGAAYNGNQPRLILKANPACGINSDVVLDTMTAAAGSWEQLTGTTAAVDADGALEFVIDCDGTVGWVNADDWSVS